MASSITSPARRPLATADGVASVCSVLSVGLRQLPSFSGPLLGQTFSQLLRSLAATGV